MPEHIVPEWHATDALPSSGTASRVGILFLLIQSNQEPMIGLAVLVDQRGRCVP